MNFGYDDGRALVDGTHPERLSLQLYVRAVEGIELSGRDVVDASCGRGGGLAHLVAHGAPASAVGVDLSPVNVALCQQRAVDARLRFVVGSATALPFDDRSVDVLLSIEASHCYVDVDQFLDEAARVLRPGGVVAWADFEGVELQAARRAACDARFDDVDDVDIADHVLRAMEADRARRQDMIRTSSPRVLWRMLDHFAGASEDVDTVRRFREGRARYFVRTLRRPR